MQQKHVGAFGELQAAAWLLQEGYEVFRNVSAHGTVDLVALKNGVLTKFDVKSTSGSRANRQLSAEQVKSGIKILMVQRDGSCEIDWNPKPPYAPEMIPCRRCQTPFLSSMKRSAFCDDKCRSHYHIENRAKKALPSSPVR